MLTSQNQYVNPIALAKLNWKYYIVYCVFIAFEFVYLYFTVIETKGKNGPLPLEEIAALFDGPQSFDNVHRVGQRAAHLEGSDDQMVRTVSDEKNAADLEKANDRYVENTAVLR